MNEFTKREWKTKQPAFARLCLFCNRTSIDKRRKQSNFISQSKATFYAVILKSSMQEMKLKYFKHFWHLLFLWFLCCFSLNCMTQHTIIRRRHVFFIFLYVAVSNAFSLIALRFPSFLFFVLPDENIKMLNWRVNKLCIKCIIQCYLEPKHERKLSFNKKNSY